MAMFGLGAVMVRKFTVVCENLNVLITGRA